MFLPVAIVGPCGASIVSDQKWEMFGYKNTDFIPDAVKNRDGKVLWNEYDKSPQRVLLSFLITLQFLHCIWFGMILRVRFELKWYVELVRFELKWYVLSWNDTFWVEMIRLDLLYFSSVFYMILEAYMEFESGLEKIPR